MKIAIKVLLGLCVSLFFTACKEEKVPIPQASITINKQQFSTNESMEINFTGVAEQVVIYPGDDMHNYELREQSNSGLVVNKGLFTYSYTSPGTYKVVCVASTYTEKAVNLKQDTCSVIVTVIDDVTEIENLSCPRVVYDEVFAERLPGDEWLITLPRKVKYNTSTPSIALSQQLKFYIHSDSTKVFINDAEYSSIVKYDLFAPVYILVRSNYGTERPYKLYTIYYPEFETFTLGEAIGVLERDVFDYSNFTIQITLPEGTDLSRLVPEFTTTSLTDKVYIGEVEQISGSSAVDFTQDISYRLVSTLDGYPDKQAVSSISINISYE